MTVLEKYFHETYAKFKLAFYQKIFNRIGERETSLTTVETFCMETIYALNRPSIQEFANFIGLSSPNAAYKVQSLIKKGYINKVQSEEDKREYYLEVTDRFLEYYDMTYSYTMKVVRRMEKRFTPEELEKLEYFLEIISNELMSEIVINPDKK